MLVRYAGRLLTSRCGRRVPGSRRPRHRSEPHTTELATAQCAVPGRRRGSRVCAASELARLRTRKAHGILDSGLAQAVEASIYVRTAPRPPFIHLSLLLRSNARTELPI